MDLPLPSFSIPESVEYDNEEYDGEGEEGDDDAEYDAEAEEIARRLGDQLLADIAKAQLEAGLTSTTSVQAASSAPPSFGPRTSSFAPLTQLAPSVSTASTNGVGFIITGGKTTKKTISTPASKSRKQEAALLTMRTIMSFAHKDPQVYATLSASLVSHPSQSSSKTSSPSTVNSSVLSLLTAALSSTSISPAIAKPLSTALVSLATSDTLFGSLKNSDAAAHQLDKGKRKRNESEDTLGSVADARYEKRNTLVFTGPGVNYPDLYLQIAEAVRVISNAFTTLSTMGGCATDPSFVRSIHTQLHQVFLFAVTSGTRASGEQAAVKLQELAGFIQMLGILSGEGVGTSPTSTPSLPPSASNGWPNTSISNPADIQTAIHPCTAPGCSKTFSRLFSLRTHTRTHISHSHSLSDRPFRCPSCPASFLRNHDLKRHAKLHERKAWKCQGCGKVFSRRDAIKRHKDSRGRSLGGKGKGKEGGNHGGDDHGEGGLGERELCAIAEIVEVEVDREEGEEETSRRAKLWNGIVANSLASGSGFDPHYSGSGSGHDSDGTIEEGEIPLETIHRSQNEVLELHPIIQSHVSSALGGAPTPMVAPSTANPPLSAVINTAGAHATLASLLAGSHPSSQPSQTATTPMPEPPMASLAPPPTVSHPAAPTADEAQPPPSSSTAPSLSLSWLSEEQTRLLEQAIADAASAAQAQAEAEAALEEEEEYDDDDDDGGEEGD